MMSSKVYLFSFLQASLMLSVLTSDYLGGSPYNNETPAPSPKPGSYSGPESHPAGPAEPYPGNSGSSKNDHDEGYKSKRDVRGPLFPIPTTSSEKPSEHPSISSTELNFGEGSFNRHRRDLPTLKPIENPSTQEPEHPPRHQSSFLPFPTPSEKPESSSTPLSFGQRQRRDSPSFQSPTSSSTTESADRDSRLFFTFPTREPQNENVTTTRRFIFNRNRRSTPAKFPSVPLGTSTDKPATSTANILSEELKNASEEPTTSRGFGASRFRRSSHEGLPEEEEDPNLTTVKSSTTTKKNFHSRVQRSSDDEEDDLFKRRTTSTEQSELHTSTVRFHPNFPFVQPNENQPESSPSTERNQFGGRFRRNDNFDSGSFTTKHQPSFEDPEISTSTKESKLPTHRPDGEFHL